MSVQLKIPVHQSFKIDQNTLISKMHLHLIQYNMSTMI